MKARSVFLGCMAIASAMGACSTQSRRIERAPRGVAPVKPRTLEQVRPPRFVLMNTVGVMYDDARESSPIRSHDNAIVAGKRLLLDGPAIVDSAPFPDVLIGFRSLPAHLGGGFVFWSDEHTYRADTFFGSLTPFANVGAKGGVRPWFDAFVLRTEFGPFEVNPRSLAVSRSYLSCYSEMISLDGKIGTRIDAIGRIEASVDGGKTFRQLTLGDDTNLVGPIFAPPNKLVFRRDRSNGWPELHVLHASGALVPFDPLAHVPRTLTPANSPTIASSEPPASTRNLAPADLARAVVAGTLLPGNQIAVVGDMSLRLLSATTGEFVQEIPLSIGSRDLGHCQPITLGENVFLACTHASGAHLFALRGTPTTVELEATFPEPREFVAGLGQRFAFLGRCGSMPPTARDFQGYAAADESADGGEPDPSAPPPPPPDPDAELPSESPPPSPLDEAAVCVRLKDGTWIERRIEGLRDRNEAFFLPGDDGNVTVVVFDKPNKDKQLAKPSEGVRFVHVDPDATGLDGFFTHHDSSEPRVRTISRDVWLDERDGSVHGWDLRLPKSDEPPEAGDDEPDTGIIGLVTGGQIVGVQIKSDGTITRHALPDAVEDVYVGGPYAVARAKTENGPTYYESTDGGQTLVQVAGPTSGEFVEQGTSEVEGCSMVGCSFGNGLVRLGWGGGFAKTTTPASANEPIDSDDLTSKVFDPRTLLPRSKPIELECRLEEADRKIDIDASAPFAVTLATHSETNIGAISDRKWTALASTPFELRPAHPVLFEDVDDIKGVVVPLLRSSGTNPVGLLLRTESSRFDLSNGPKRKPTATDVRVTIAAELDHDKLLLVNALTGDLQLARGTTVRLVGRIEQVPDVNVPSFALARRAGSGDDVVALGIVRSGSGDILLADLDLGGGFVNSFRLVGNMQALRTGASCVRGPRDYRMVLAAEIPVRFQPAHDGRVGRHGSSLVTVGSDNACLEASEVHLADGATLVVRFSEGGTSGFPALLHAHGKALRARCVWP